LVWLYRWLTPAMACLLLTLSVLQRQNAFPRPDVSHGSLLAGLSWSNQIAGFGDNNAHNLWDQVSFEWTKGCGITSTVSSLTPFQTNGLIR
jgi:hypothetical protein